MPDPKAGDRYLRTLDGWRAIAISMVLASHALTVDSARDSAGGIPGLLTFRLGTFGVMIFFAISGYLICTRLLVEGETTGSVSLQSFYIRRIFRIFPAAYLYLAVIVVLVLGQVITVHPADIVIPALFVSNYVVVSSWFTGHFWSLALEEHFYLLWPPLLVNLGRKRALWIAMVLIAVSALLRSYTVATAPPGADLPGYTHLRLDAFMFPCILAILLRQKTVADKFRRVMTPPAWCGLLAILASGVFLAATVHAWREPQRLLQGAVLPLIIAATVARPHDWMGRMLQLRVLEWLGRVSYSVYLWQQLVFGFAPREWLPRALAMPFLLAAILVLAATTRRSIELPMIRLGKRLAATSESRELEAPAASARSGAS